jgi:multidrug resistance efflux pump
MSDNEEKRNNQPGGGRESGIGIPTPSLLKKIISRIRGNPIIIAGFGIILVGAIIGGILFWRDLQSKVYIEKSEIYAPVISLSPKNPGEIDKFYVKEGDVVEEGQNLAKIEGQIITAKTPGIITWIANTPGQMANAQTVVVKMYDPHSLRVIGHVQEDKGLSAIHPGQQAVFTVDAYDGRQYSGVVESVASVARQGSIVFSISDKREEKEFDVNVVFDPDIYPELKDGMSAKMWIFK